MLRDRRLWAFVAANALSMVGYSLWTNWTTQYLVDEHRLTLRQAAWYAWIPPVFAMAGGFAGGWLSLPLHARRQCPPPRRASASASPPRVVSLATAAIPAAPTPAWAIRRNFAQHLRRCGLQRQHVHACRSIPLAPRAPHSPSPFWWRPTAPSQFADLAGLRRAHRSPSVTRRVTTVAALTPLAACAVLWGTRSVAMKQRLKRWIFRLLRQGPGSRGRDFLHRRAELVPPHGRGSARAGSRRAAISSPPKRTGLSCARHSAATASASRQ